MFWLPIIGPVIEGVVSIFKKQQDTKLEMKKIDGEVYIKASEIQAQTLRDFRDQIDIRIARDILIYPVVIMSALVTWDRIVDKPHPEWVWGVKPFIEGTGFEYLPYAVMAFLLGNIALNKWKS